MVYSYIDVINENLSLRNPDLYKKLLKKLNKRDIAIFSLLSNGNSILFISNSSSNKIKFYNNLASFDLDFLVCEFENDIHDESFLEYLIEDSNANFDVNVDDLLVKKSNLDLTMDILSNQYSNLKLTPAELKAKKDHYLNNLNGEELIFPVKYVSKYDVVSVNNIVEAIKILIRKYGDVFTFYGVISIDFLKSEEYDNLVNISNSFNDNLKEFKALNIKLNNLLGIKIFPDLDSVEILENLFIDQNKVYIEKNDRSELDKILKQYFSDSSINITSNTLIKKYSNENADLLGSILNNIKYSELVDSDILIDDNKRQNLFLLEDKVDFLIRLSKYLKKQLYSITKFYQKHDFFERDPDSFNTNNDFNDLVESFDMFCNDLNKIKKYKEFMEYSYDNEDVKFFIDLVLTEKVEKNVICDVFQFNVYNHLLNNFFDEFDFIDESKLNVKDYVNEIRSINGGLGDSTIDQFINLIKFSPNNLKKSEVVQKQKEELELKVENNDCDSILNIFQEFKELIMANRRIFIINEMSLETLYDLNYVDEFDYIFDHDKIITKLNNGEKLWKFKKKIFF